MLASHQELIQDLEQLEKKSQIYSNSVASVFLVQYQDKTYALKQYNNNQNNQQQIISETQYFTETPPNQQMLKCLQIQNNLFLLEYMQNGDLADYLIQNNKPFPQNLSRYYFQNLVFAINYMHENLFIHRDIKLENILLDHEFNLKLCDFGFSQKLKSKNEQCSDFIGTKGYYSPQLKSKEPYNGIKNDIFALGIILFQLVIGGLPFKEPWKQDMMYRLFITKNDKYWENIRNKYDLDLSNDFIDLVNGILHHDEYQRFSMKQIICHTWFKQQKIESHHLINYMSELKEQIKNQPIN